MTTETLDKLYLELSQFTRVKTVREIALEAKVKAMRDDLRTIHGIAVECETDNMYGVDETLKLIADYCEAHGDIPPW